MKKNLYILVPVALLVGVLAFVTNINAAFSAEDPSKPDNKNECGPAAGDYWADDEDYRGNYCSKAEPSQPPGFPMPGEGVEWQCTASGAPSSDCKAYRSILTEAEHLDNQEKMKEETKMDRLIKNVKQLGSDFKRGLEVIGDALWPF